MSTSLSQVTQHVGDRFPDWSQRDERGRVAAEAQCRSRLQTTGVALHAVARVFPPKTGAADGGPLAGLPYVIKDMIANGHEPASWGFAAPLNGRVEAAAVVNALNGAGARMIGAAEMTSLAYEPSGVNVARGHVLNPWNASFVPGGSSSGSAALVAAGCCDVALGSDTGGSVRIPAHCCGITALKPGWGAVPDDGTMPLAPSLDTIGILARSAADIAPVWAVLGPASAGQAGIKQAVVIEGVLAECDAEIATLFRDAIAYIERLDVKVSARPGFPQSADEACLLVMQAEAARSHRELIVSDKLDPVMRKRLGKGFDITDADLAATLARREAARDEFISRYLGDAQVALLPVMPVTTPRYSDTDPSSSAFNARRLYAMSRFTRFVNYLGLPALALPMGFDSHGMPAALQMVGRLGSEAALLDLGQRFQNITDWHGRVPSGLAAIASMKTQGK